MAQELVEKVKHRTVQFNNREWGAHRQVAMLLATADNMLEKTASAPLPLLEPLASRLAASLDRLDDVPLRYGGLALQS